MSSKYVIEDLKIILTGIQKVLKTDVIVRKADIETKLTNSNLTGLVSEIPKLPSKVLPQTPKDVQDLVQRSSMVGYGIKELSSQVFELNQRRFKSQGEENVTEKGAGQKAGEEEEIVVVKDEDIENAYFKSLGPEILKEYQVKGAPAEGSKPNLDKFKGEPSKEQHLSQHEKEEEEMFKLLGQNIMPFYQPETPGKDYEDKLNLIRDIADGKKMDKEVLKAHIPESEITEDLIKKKEPEPVPTKPISKERIKPLSLDSPQSQLGATSKERKVPATRISRLVSYGSLAAGLGIGALTEFTRRSIGIRSHDNSALLDSSPFFSDSNIERIVDTLCRVRGAALKLGQMLSLQDNSIINPQLQKAFERVRNSADFMPFWQMEKVMEKEFGVKWRDRFQSFDPRPFAAASIGQVHLAKLHDGRVVAVKIQYPGVAQGIESDIDNLVSILNVWNILPRGIFIDKIIVVAKRELAWETKYLREAECAKRFQKLLEPFPEFYVPEIIDDLTTDSIYTTELIEGMPVDKCASLDQETRDRISFLMLDLFFRELFEFRFMQTDPNWSNFLYNVKTKQIGLLDFGASREYGKEFVDTYMMILKGGADNDRKSILEYSKKIGFLTGYESKSMENAHVETVNLLAQALRIRDEPFDFGNQEITQKIARLAGIMVAERLCPPPEEVYSLHRKLSGMFLLCTKLKGRVRCREIFDRIWDNYKFGDPTANSSDPSPSNIKL